MPPSAYHRRQGATMPKKKQAYRGPKAPATKLAKPRGGAMPYKGGR